MSHPIISSDGEPTMEIVKMKGINLFCARNTPSSKENQFWSMEVCGKVNGRAVGYGYIPRLMNWELHYKFREYALYQI